MSVPPLFLTWNRFVIIGLSLQKQKAMRNIGKISGKYWEKERQISMIMV